MDYIKRSDAELRQLARDIREGRVITDRCLPEQDPIDQVFLPLAYLPDADHEELRGLPIGMIYEYKARANPQDNGCVANFDTFEYLNQEDTDRLDETLDRLEVFRVV